jgi:GLPGLI family protein
MAKTILKIKQHMKTKNFTLLILCFYFSICTSQNGGIATYTVSVVENEDDFMQQQMKEAIPDILDYVADLRFQLFFNEDESYFILEDKLYKSQIVADASSLVVKYTNPSIKVGDKKYHKSSKKRNVFPGKWVSSEINNDWEITQETKQINNYTVYKAIGRYAKGNSRVGYKKMKATAWFCPELPLPHGPLDFGGLPGLIFELNFENVTYGIEKIEFKVVEIPKVDFENVVTSKAVEKKFEELYGNQ